MKILLIAGGWSPEREISLKGAENIEKTLKSLGHDVTFFDLSRQFDELLNIASLHDFAFINLHGSPGEDGLAQAMLDAVNIPYQGAGAAASFLALNKAAAKQIFKFSGLPTPDWEFLPVPPAKSWQPRFAYPIFAKSDTGGSSLHLGRAANRQELDKILNDIFAHGDAAILEPALPGRDLTCGVLGAEALPPILIEPVSGSFFDYQSKYATGGAREICPAPIPEAISRQAQKIALEAHMALGLKGCSRSDFILDKQNRLFLLEVNTLPGMTSTSLVPQEAAAIGLDFGQLLQKLIELGIKDRKKR